MEDFFRQQLASLSGSAAKVALAWMIAPSASKPELMRLSGVTHRGTFYRAWRSLEGYLGAEIVPLTYQNRTVDVPFPNQVYHYPALPVPFPNQVYQNRTDDVPNPNQSAPNPNQEDIEAAIAQADGMDGSGDERQPTSPFQIRRKQQLTLIQQAWVDTFGQELTPLAAKELLQVAHSQALISTKR